jgi:hypothetical protein
MAVHTYVIYVNSEYLYQSITFFRYKAVLFPTAHERAFRSWIMGTPIKVLALQHHLLFPSHQPYNCQRHDGTLLER